MSSDINELTVQYEEDGVVTVKNLVQNAWIRLLIVDPESGEVSVFEDGEWQKRALHAAESVTEQESAPL